MLKVVLYIIYYAAVLGISVLFAFLFPSAVVFDWTSIVPLLVAALMLWQAWSLYTSHVKKAEAGGATAEAADYILCVVHSYLIFTPFCFPLMLFLNAWGKSLAILPFLLAIFAGAAAYKRRRRKREAKAEKTEEAEAGD